MTGTQRQWAMAEIRIASDGSEKFIALAVNGEIVALIEPAKVKRVLRMLGE